MRRCFGDYAERGREGVHPSLRGPPIGESWVGRCKLEFQFVDVV